MEEVSLTDDFILKYDYLVKIIAGSYFEKLENRIELDELISYGYLGLISAIENYDSNRETSFKTYASIIISDKIIDNVKNNGLVFRTMINGIEQYYEQNNMKVTEKMLADKLNVSVRKIKEYKKNKESDDIINSQLDDYSQVDSKKIQLIELRMILSNIIDKLSDIEKRIINLYYYMGYNDKEIGNIMNINTSRIYQVRIRALCKMGKNENKQLLKSYKNI